MDYIIRQYVHAKAGRENLSGDFANFPCTDDTGSFPSQIHAHQAVNIEVEFCGAVIAQMGFPVHGLQQGDCVLRHSSGGIAGYPQHFDIQFCRPFQIHAVKSGAAKQNDTDAVAGDGI